MVARNRMDLLIHHRMPITRGRRLKTTECTEGHRDKTTVHNIAEFAAEMRTVAQECMCVLKPDKHCAVLIGGTRRNKHFVPITPRVLMGFLEAGFILREDIIKMQWKMKSTREKWFGKKYDFYLIGHEHLYVFRKPDEGEGTTKFKESMRWW